MDLRRQNRDLVLRAIMRNGSASRTEIAKEVGLTNAAVSRITRELIRAGLVNEGERIVLKGQAGRRKVSLELSETGAFVLGFAVTLNAREVVIANSQGKIVARRDCSDVSLGDPDTALGLMARRARELIRQSGIDQDRILGGAASVAGRIDPNDGRLIGAEPLNWDRQGVSTVLENLIKIPFVAEGRAAALLQAEHRQGLAAGLSDVLLVNVGLKMGTALMVDGRLLRGTENAVCRMERYKVSDTADLDQVASGSAVLSRLETGERPTTDNGEAGSYLRQVTETLAYSHKPTAQVSGECGMALGKAIRHLTPILSPQLVLLAGLVGRHPAYIDGVQAALAEADKTGADIVLRTSHLTTAQSAVWLALDTHLFSRSLDIDRLIAA